MSADVYCRELKNIEAALKRSNEQVKQLRAKKKLNQERLYTYMVRHGLEEYEGYKLSKITPRPKVIRKKAKDKKADAISLFSQVGIPDPEDFWATLQSSQKPIAYDE
jgi:hypothetical protein